MQVGLACDHGGFGLKEDLKAFLKSMEIEAVDLGSFDETSVDYPDFGIQIAERVSRGELEKGILICGTGIGMSIVANKHKGIRAAACESPASAKLSREHNDANILCFGSRIISWETAIEIVKMFLSTPFSGGERHMCRIEKIHSLTNL